MFRPFAQASEAISQRYGGTGLGLILVKRLARAMGGDLTVVSKSGSGSTFRLSVLVETPSMQPERKHRGSRVRGGPRTGGFAILCAEDNPYGRVVLNTILTELGHRAEFVGSGEAAIEAAMRGGYDLVLMDVALTGIDGIEAARRIRALPSAASRVPDHRPIGPQRAGRRSERARRGNESLPAQAGQLGGLGRGHRQILKRSKHAEGQAVFSAACSTIRTTSAMMRLMALTTRKSVAY